MHAREVKIVEWNTWRNDTGVGGSWWNGRRIKEEEKRGRNEQGKTIEWKLPTGEKTGVEKTDGLNT